MALKRIFVGTKVVGYRDTSSGKITKADNLSKNESKIYNKRTGSSKTDTTEYATEKAKQIMDEIDPKQSQNIQVIKQEQKDINSNSNVKTKAEYATPNAARVLKDIGYKGNVKVSTSDSIPQLKIKKVSKELNKENYTVYQVAKAAKLNPWQVLRRPEPYQPKEKKVYIGKDPRQPQINKKAFYQNQAEVWATKKSMANKPKEKPSNPWASVLLGKNVARTIANPDIVFKENENKMDSVLGKSPIYSTGKLISNTGPLLGSAMEKTGTFFSKVNEKIKPFVKESKYIPGPIQTMYYGGKIGETYLKGEGQNIKEKPIGTSLRAGATYVTGMGFGYVEGKMAVSTVTTTGAKATKAAWKIGTLGMGGLYGMEQTKKYKEAETSQDKDKVIGETITDLGLFTIGGIKGYKIGSGKTGGKVDVTPIESEKPTRFKESFIKREYNKESKSWKWYEIDKSNPARKQEINRADIKKYKDLFGLQNKKGESRLSITREEGKTSRLTDRPKYENVNKERSLMESKPKPIINTKPKSISRSRSINEIRPTSRSKGGEISIYKGSDIVTKPRQTDIILRQDTKDLVSRRKYEVTKQDPRDIISRKQYDLIKPDSNPKPNPPGVRGGGGGLGGGFPFGFSFGGNIGGGGIRGFFNTRKRTVKGKKGDYLPSLSAITFGIKGTTPKGELSGLEQRPLPIK